MEFTTFGTLRIDSMCLETLSIITLHSAVRIDARNDF